MTNKPLNVLIDSDIGWDDVMSILLLLKCPQVNILGITVTGCGETFLGDGVEIARGLLAMTGNAAPVCAGAERPSSYDHVFPASFRANMNDLMGLRLTLPAPSAKPDRRSARELMLELLDKAAEPVTIISLGGLTNIADALNWSTAKQRANIARIVVMGGAINDLPDGKGNVADLNNAMRQWDQGPIYSTNTYAEWNIFIDPLAAHTVFSRPELEGRITLVALNACNHVILEESYADLITATDPVATLLKKIVTAKTGASSEGIDVAVFDPLATLYGVGLLNGVTVRAMNVGVELRETIDDNHCGQTFVGGDTVLGIATGANADEFRSVFARLANAPMPVG